MPEYLPGDALRFYVGLGWLLLVAFLLAFVLLLREQPLAALFFLLVGILIYADTRRQKRKFTALAEARRDLSICQFARSFDRRITDTGVIRAVYEQLQEYMDYAGEGFPIMAEDKLVDLLEIDEDELEFRLIKEIAQRSGRSLENSSNNPFYAKLETVRDLVEFFNAQPLSARP